MTQTPGALLVLLAAAFALAGCGQSDVEREVADARERVERAVDRQVDEARREFEERRKRYGRRIDDVLRDLERLAERPERTSPTVRSRGRNEPQTVDAFLTDVLEDVDRFWSRTFARGGLPEPRVGYSWVPPGGLRISACGQPADDRAAFYCPADDTIYLGQAFAAALYRGVLDGLPGDRRAAGDFAVAYVVAHEYAHNLQQELGVFDNRSSPSAKPFELQADCLSGVWAFSVFSEGALEPGDLREATDAARAVGDFDVDNEQHHGTPDERETALRTGYDGGDPAACNRFLT